MSTVTETPPAAAHRAEPQAGYRLEVEHVTKRYGHNVVLDDLTFMVEPGRVTGFLGPNGSGKSTTMKILLGLASADGGRTSLNGVAYRDLPDPARTVGVVLEPNAFHPGRTARNHLKIVADSCGIPLAKVDETLDLVGLATTADRKVGAYSLGMRQRLSLAGALLGEPPVLVLDEPGNGLDPQGIRALRDLLRAEADRGHTVFLSSHLLAEVEHLADELVVLDRGKLMTTGKLSDLQIDATRVRTPSPERLAEVLHAGGGLVEVVAVDALTVRGLRIEAIGDLAFGSGIVLHELSRDASSLEDLFLGWTGKADSVDLRQSPKKEVGR